MPNKKKKGSKRKNADESKSNGSIAVSNGSPSAVSQRKASNRVAKALEEGIQDVEGLLRRPNAPRRSLSAPPDDACIQKIRESLPLDLASHTGHVHKKKPTPFREKKRFIFGLGAFIGVLLAVLFAKPPQVDNSMWEVMLEAMDNSDWVEDIRGVLPSGFLNEAKRMEAASKGTTLKGDPFSAGIALAKKGVTANHPVVMVPGVISTGLESWSTEETCALPYFRKRLWGSWNMMRAMLLDKTCWMDQLKLDLHTGLDPSSGGKIRAAQGFDAADFFITGYWIWSKIIENLAAIGYDPNNMLSAAYDWRLAYGNNEVRDHYFSKLKMYIEYSVKFNEGKKAVITGHSMGAQVIFWFMKWVESPLGGNGGPTWVNDHIDSFINISGSMLGTPKAIAALLSGEMKDTAQLNAFSVYGLEKFLSKQERADLLRSFPGIASMLPKGGDAVWGNETWAPDDIDPETGEERSGEASYGSFINFRPENTETGDNLGLRNLSLAASFDYLMQHTPHSFHKMLATNYSHGVAHTAAEVEANNRNPAKWINPLEVSLPHAPDMKIYCLYGVGKPTERGYWYTEDSTPGAQVPIEKAPAEEKCPCMNSSQAIPKEFPWKRPTWIDNTVNIPDMNVDHGVRMGEGDGTVSLISTGYMCVKGWTIPRYNPANVSVITYEMLDQPDRFDIRGGPSTADHVDVLGRAELNEFILRISAGESIPTKIISRIKEIAERVHIS
ncbi:phospholipid:diacylglycerol acyltransferase [Saitoella coloradoensis]